MIYVIKWNFELLTSDKLKPTTQASSLYAKVEEVVGAPSSQVDQGSRINISMDQRKIKKKRTVIVGDDKRR